MRTEKQKEYSRKWYIKNRSRLLTYQKVWREENKALDHRIRREEHLSRKTEVLTAYGKDGKLQCCWPECEITDVDMLSLDHIDENGASHRKEFHNQIAIYRWLKKNNYPVGFQTLCMNHQIKKHLLFKRQQRKEEK
jgi:hypothetical protein